MKHLLPLVLGFMATSALAGSLAAPSSSGESFALIHQGDWNVGAHLELSRRTGRNANDSISLGTNARYFFADRIAAGASIAWDDQSNGNATLGIGPSALYYFCDQGRLLPYISASTRYGLTGETFNWFLSAELGANYFVHPSVAFGPALYATKHVSSHTSDNNHQNYGLFVGFDIFL